MNDHFDMSNFEPTKPYYEPWFAAIKSVVGKMKDEVPRNPLAEFVGLRPKMYSFEAVKIKPDGSTERSDKYRAKGIQRAAAERFLKQQYLDHMHNRTENYVLNRRLGCRLHPIYCMEVSHPYPTDQNFACHDPFHRMSAPVQTCHDPFFDMA